MVSIALQIHRSQAIEMPRIFNRPEEKEIRRYLRRYSTQTERIMWNILRKKQIRGYKFRRQYSVGAFILDFYSPRLELAIEIDGISHATSKAMKEDAIRQRIIEEYGIRFLRFNDEEVLNNAERVIEKIEKAIEKIDSMNISKSL